MFAFRYSLPLGMAVYVVSSLLRPDGTVQATSQVTLDQFPSFINGNEVQLFVQTHGVRLRNVQTHSSSRNIRAMQDQPSDMRSCSPVPRRSQVRLTPGPHCHSEDDDDWGEWTHSGLRRSHDDRRRPRSPDADQYAGGWSPALRSLDALSLTGSMRSAASARLVDVATSVIGIDVKGLRRCWRRRRRWEHLGDRRYWRDHRRTGRCNGRKWWLRMALVVVQPIVGARRKLLLQLKPCQHVVRPDSHAAAEARRAVKGIHLSILLCSQPLFACIVLAFITLAMWLSPEFVNNLK